MEDTINPYNFNNKELTIDFVSDILRQYQIIEEPKNLLLYQHAFVHKSYRKVSDINYVEKPEGALELFDTDYERLEFMGDSILGAVVASYLYERFEGQNEGFLSTMKVKLVRKHALAYFSKELGFAPYIIMSRHTEDINKGRANIDILEDTFEAFLGALYLDLGYNIVFDFMIGLIEDKVDFSELIMTNTNYKGTLTRHYQKMYQQKLSFDIIEKGMEYCKMGVYDPEKKLIGTGDGVNKKLATQDACKNCLIKLGIVEN